ncbi:hypothetical protein BOX15_Mlig017977g2 [Macrostomum lignano]|uniref:UspA domain-containing protein n=1 Tax=Macrostomum lignano TaxID=282301 RepID=A0A267GVZ8_9PLAT|nr:hypothetical protein BOX15_Mlig017977g2 [Macrostomum lignano]
MAEAAAASTASGSSDGKTAQEQADYRKASITSEMSMLKLADQTAPRRVLLPVDGSQHSERAFHWFLGNLYRNGDIAVLAFVLDPPQYSPADGQSGSSFVQEGNKAYNDGLKEANRLKAKFFGQLKQLGLPASAAQFQELIGTKPGETLVKFIHESDINCVVIGSRGLGKIKRTFLGSVSDHLLHNANCPVIICPNKKDKDKDKDKKDKDKEKKDKDKKDKKDKESG